MQNAYSINKSDTLNFVNKSLVNGLSKELNGERVKIHSILHDMLIWNEQKLR